MVKNTLIAHQLANENCVVFYFFFSFNDMWFPRAAVTKYHKLDSIKQEKCILLQFCRLFKSKIKLSAGPVTLDGILPRLFLVSGDGWQS